MRARFRAEHVPITRLGGDSVRAMDAGLDVCDEALRSAAARPGTALSRCIAFTGTGYPFALMVRIVKREIFPQIAVAWALVSVFLLITNHPLAAMVMSVLLGGAVVCLLGLIRAAGIAIDPTSLAGIVISSGMVADFMVHISHVAVTSVGDAAERVRSALRKMGPSVLQAGTSTILGTGVLLFARAKGFLFFAGVFILTVCVGLTTGLVVLPAVLRLVLGTGAAGEPDPMTDARDRVKPQDEQRELESVKHQVQAAGGPA